MIAEERDRGGGLSRLCVLKDGEQVDLRDPEELAQVSVFEEVGVHECMWVCAGGRGRGSGLSWVAHHAHCMPARVVSAALPLPPPFFTQYVSWLVSKVA